MSKAILRPIIPRSPLYHTAAMERALKAALHKTGLAMKKSFEETTATWDTDVRFAMRSSLDEVTVSTDNAIYGYVSGGTKPHVIRPRRARFLRFRPGYRAKTSVRGSTAAHAGGSFGPSVFALAVHHPGTKARHFERRVAIKYQDVFPAVIQDAINRAVKEG